MDWCRVVGPRGLCRSLAEKPTFLTNNPPLAPRVIFSEILAGPGPWNLPAWDPKPAPGRSKPPDGKKVISIATTVLVYREALTLPHRSDEMLGRGPRSDPRA